MKSSEFIIETPLPAEQDPDKVWNQTGIWNHTYVEPGKLRGEYNWSNTDDNFDRDDDYDFEEEKFELLRKNKAKELGAGAEAVTIRYDANHEVVKILGTNAKLSQCAHLQYLLACKKYMNSNPYLPRIESIKTVNYDGTRLLYTITMEPLEELLSVSDRDYGAMLNVMFGISPTPDEEDATLEMITRGVKQVIRKGNTKGVDPKLVQAAKIIRAVGDRVSSKGFEEILDLHAGNFMVRRTSVGPQCVITDPLYSGPTGVRDSYAD